MPQIHKLLGCLALASLLGCERQPDPPLPPGANLGPAPSARPDKPANDSLHGTCVLKASHMTRLKAQVGGEIQAVHVKRGEVVRKGQVLAEIDTRSLLLRRERAQLELQRLQAKGELLQFHIERATAEHKVAEQLAHESGLKAPAFGKEKSKLSETRLEQRENELNQTAVQLDLRTIADQLHRAALRAPADGVVLARLAEPGMVVSSASEGFGGSEVLFELGDPGTLVGHCLIKEADAALLKNKAEAILTMDALPELQLQTQVSSLAPAVLNEGGLARREFELALPKPAPAGLLPGMHAVVAVAIKP